jgi:hypothetical protein
LNPPVQATENIRINSTAMNRQSRGPLAAPDPSWRSLPAESEALAATSIPGQQQADLELQRAIREQQQSARALAERRAIDDAAGAK